MTLVKPFGDLISALRRKDAGLFLRLGNLPPHEFWREWKKTYPEDLKAGSERLANWDQRRAAFKSHSNQQAQ